MELVPMSDRLVTMDWASGRAVANMSPGAFAFIMATGIISHDLGALGLKELAALSLLVAIVAYACLLVLTVIRVVCFPRRVMADLGSQQHGPGFLTLVAATGILGVALAPILRRASAAVWLLDAVLWVGLTYAFLADVAAHARKPQATRGISGNWLLAVVATQSVALLGPLVATQFGDMQELVLFASVCLFLIGCFLYLALVPLIVQRLELLSLTPRQFTPDYWINMGAMAITTLAGTTLISVPGQWPFFRQVVPFLVGLTLLFWAGATWWIPLLILLETWRHLLRHVRVVYSAEYWSAVFPVGMYAACTFELAALIQLNVLLTAATWFAYVAAALWIATFIGFARHVVGASRITPRALHVKLPHRVI